MLDDIYKSKCVFLVLFTAESDISTFASRKEHFRAKDDVKTTLFTSETRPKILRELYEAAAVVAVRSLDSISRDDRDNSTDLYLCTPVLGKRRYDSSLDIESRVVSQSFYSYEASRIASKKKVKIKWKNRVSLRGSHSEDFKRAGNNR